MKPEDRKQVSISKAVSSLLMSKPFLKDLFRIDAVNYSGLARHIIPELKKILGRKTITIEAVVMAIRRFADKIPKENISENMARQIAQFDISVKNNIIELSLPQSSENYHLVLEAYSRIDWQGGEIMYIFHSIGEISVLMDERNYEKLLKKDVEEDALNLEKNLSLFMINTPKEMIEVPGEIHYFTHLLAENDISIVDMASTFTTLLFVVQDKEATKVYELFNKAIKDAKEFIA